MNISKSIRAGLLAAGLLLLCHPDAQAQRERKQSAVRIKFAYVGEPHDGRVLVASGGGYANPLMGKFKTRGLFGYLDTLGGIAIPFEYDYGSDFRDGYAVVGVGEPEQRRFGIIDTTGRRVVPCMYADVLPFSDGRALLLESRETGRKYGYADTTGRIAIPMEYDYAAVFRNGTAVVGRGSWSTDEQGRWSFDGKAGVIDTTGRMIIPLEYDDASLFSEGLAAVGREGKYYVLWGYVDRSGELVIPMRYYEAGDFQDGLALVSRVMQGAPRYGFIDKTGDEVIPCQYDYAKPFAEGLAWVGVGVYPDCAYWLIDRTGRNVLSYKVYDLNDSGRYGHVSAAVPDENGVLRYGLLSKTGRVVVPFEYDRITIFSERDPKTGRMVERGSAERAGKSVGFTVRKRD